MRKKKILKHVAALALLLGATGAMAQATPTISVGTDEGRAGDPVSVPVTFDNAGNEFLGFAVEVDFDLAVLGAGSPVCTLNEPYASYQLAVCRIQPGDPEGDLIEIGLIDNIITPGAVPSGEIATLSFVIDAAAMAGTTPLTLLNPDLGAPATVTLNDGSINVLPPPQPDWSSAPPTGLAATGSVIQNDTDPTADIVVTNVGEMGSLLSTTAACTETDPNNLFSFSTLSVTDLAAGASTTITMTFDSAGAIGGPYTASISCPHNGDGTTETSPAVYSFEYTITAGPQAAYSSTPAPGAGIPLQATEEGDPDPTATISITNTGDVDGPNLTGSCGMAVGSDAEITVGGATFNLAVGAGSFVETVTCDATAEGSYSGTVECTHNGANIATPATYPVSCTVGPPGDAVPVSTPADMATIDLGTAKEGDATAPTADLVIRNDTTDPADSDLGIACMYSGAPEITVTTAPTSPLAPDSETTVTFSCDTATGSDTPYEGTYSCDYDVNEDMVNEASASWPVTCTIEPPADAVPASTPADATEIAMTPDGAVLEGSTAPTAMLEIRNEAADPLDYDLGVSCSLATGTVITETTAPVGPVAPGASTMAAFSCDTTTAGDYTDTYTCDYDVDEDQVNDASASWPVSCSVRAAEAVVATSPANGDTLSDSVPPGETTTFSVTFTETAGEGVDAELTSCSLGGTAGFTVDSPTTFPATIASGGSVAVTVTGTAPEEAGETASDVLTCVYTDTTTGEGGVTVAVTLSVEAQVIITQPIPTMSAWSKLFMFLLLAGLGAGVIRRQMTA